MQFLWAVYELSRLIDSWTALKFVTMIVLALLLFVSGALILPRETSAGGGGPFEVFVRDGRWALISLAAYCMLAFLVNPVFFGTPIFGPLNMFLLVLVVILAATFFARNRTWWVMGTVIFAAGTLAAVVLLSPHVYQ